MLKHAAIWGAALAFASTVSACDRDDEASPMRLADAGASEVHEAGRVIEFAKRDVIRRFGYDRDDVRLVDVESVTWSDGALGCPRPDRVYTQALVPGYRVELQWHDVEHRYHGENGSDPFLCGKSD